MGPSRGVAMLRVFLASHAHLASGLQSAVELLAGIGDRLFVCDAYVDRGTFDVSGALNDFLADAAPDDQILLLSDLYGGSVNTALVPALVDPRVRLVSGANLAFVLAVLLEDAPIDDDRLAEMVEEARGSLRVVSIGENDEQYPPDDGTDGFFE